MRAEHRAWLLAGAGFSVGVLFTLVVITFMELPDIWLRVAILGGILCCGVVLLVAYWRLVRHDARRLDSLREMRRSRARESRLVVSRIDSSTRDAAPERRQASSTVERDMPRLQRREVAEDTDTYSLNWQPPDPPQSSIFGERGYTAAGETKAQRSEPARSESPSSEQLIEVWETYLRLGDGRFNAVGLRRQLSEAGIHGEVLAGERIGAGDNVLAVDLRDGTDNLYLLPNFGKPPRAVADWFNAPISGSRMARIQRLLRITVASRTAQGIVIQTKGMVE